MGLAQIAPDLRLGVNISALKCRKSPILSAFTGPYRSQHYLH